MAPVAPHQLPKPRASDGDRIVMHRSFLDAARTDKGLAGLYVKS